MDAPPAPLATILYEDARLEQPVLHAVGEEGAVAVLSTRSPIRSGDEPNQDGALIATLDARRTVLAVADGLGGYVGGADAARTTLAILADALTARDPAVDVRSTILDAIECANAAIIERGIGSGTTIAVLEIDSGVVRPYHVGDSDVIVTGQRGRVRLQTIAHSPVAYAREAGVLTEAEAMHHAERHLVSNMVGSPSMRIEMGPSMPLRARDTVLLCTDGLADNLYPEEIVNIIRCGPLRESAKALAGLCRDRMSGARPGTASKPDDLTFLAYRPRVSPRDLSA
jgi:serine/threonine protein phosphatase PrpC